MNRPYRRRGARDHGLDPARPPRPPVARGARRAQGEGRRSPRPALVADGHPQTLRQLRWTNTMIKTPAPQLPAGV
ncbi:hypothetical protein ACFZC7_38605 [Streptomyces massasporeus]|uniref:hypothetical protein n=1 Tax=Streptomyces massasporeus TaxID=67324 RepID=UPI0036EFB72B